MLCPSCKNIEINASRNKRRLCKVCTDKIRYENNRFSTVELFSFQSGCKKAVPTLKTDQSFNAAKMIYSNPIHLAFCSNDATVQTYVMIDKDNLTQLQTAMTFKNDGSKSSTITQYRITLHEPNDQTVQKPASNDHVTEILAESFYPRTEAVFGEFIEMDKDLAAQLNTDFRIFFQWLRSVVDLHTGCLIHNDHITAFIITAEVYSKHSSTDVHAESLGVSSPQEETET